MKIPHYINLKPLRAGGCSQVYQAQDQDTLEKVAIKVLNLIEISETYFLHEVEMYKKLQHVRGFVRMYEYGTWEDNQVKYGYIVMELGQGDLQKLPLNPTEYFNFFAFMVRTLTRLHDMGWVYNDLKRENIIRFGSGFKITDFMSIIKNKSWVRELYGTPHVLAPELIEPFINQVKLYVYTDKVDTWGLGILMYEVIMRKNPFGNHNHLNREEMFYNIASQTVNFQHEFFQQYPGFQAILTKCLQKDPQKRPHIKQILQKFKNHPSFWQSVPSSSIFKESSSLSSNSSLSEA